MNIGDGSFDLRLTFHNARQCDRASVVPGVERLDGRTVRVTGRDMTVMLHWTIALISLGGS
jgi:D-amino peptidase